MPDETSTTGETSGGPVTTTAPPMGFLFYADSPGTVTEWNQLGVITDSAPAWASWLSRILPTVRQNTADDRERRRADYDEYISCQSDRAAESERRRQSASEQAKELLFRYLDPVNQHRYEHFNYIEFEGSDGRTYRLSTGTYTGNIFIIEDGATASRWCAHGPIYDPEGRSIPIADMILTQMIALKTDAAAVMAIANQY